jgi:outer membrane lipoprotein-sorting protein
MTDCFAREETDRLDRAIDALRDMPVPAGPPPHVVASTVEALHAGKESPGTVRVSERRTKMFRVMQYSSFTAASIALAVLVAWLVLLDRTATLAFADVVEKVANAKSVTFHVKSELGKQPAMLQKFYMQGSAYRMEIPSGGQAFAVPADAPPTIMALIADAEEKQALELNFTEKTAKKRAVDGEQWAEMAQADLIGQFRRLTDKDAQRIADEELNGQKTHVYRLKKVDFFGGRGVVEEGESAKVWVDPESGLPVRIELVSLSADKKDKARMVFDEFVWNQPLDETLFSLEVPEGFTLQDE